MFKVIADYDDPTQVRILNSPLEAFDPRINPPPPSLTWNQVFNALKVLYCRENLLAYPHFFFNIAFSGNRTDQLQLGELAPYIINAIPDEQLYLLHYYVPYHIKSNYHLYAHAYRPSEVSVSQGYCFNYTYNIDAQSSGCSIRGDAFKDVIIARLAAVAADIEQYLLRDYGDRLIHPTSTSPNAVHDILDTVYFNYIRNRDYIHDSTTNSNLAAEQVLQVLEQNPTATLTNGSANNFSLRIFNPVTKQNKAAICKVFNYSTNPMTLLSHPIVAKGEHNPLLYGIELELATDYSVTDIITASDEPFFIVKQDQSVSGTKRNKYELVTVPMSFKAHKKQWAYWFSNLDYTNFDVSHTTNNGMHVHIGRTAFHNATHIKNFTWFFVQPAHVKFMQAFSMRTPESWISYSNTPNFNGSRVNSYNRIETNVKTMRGCINFSPKGTLEVRMFKGVVSLADMVKNLEFVDSIFHYTSQPQNFTKLSLSNYLSWLKSAPKNKYAVLRKYLDMTPKLLKMVEGSSILNVIFNETRPDRILDLVKKSKIQVTQDDVTTLNQKFKKRIFILDKETQQLVLANTATSLAHLDRTLQKRLLHGSPPPRPQVAPTPSMPTPPLAAPDEGPPTSAGYALPLNNPTSINWSTLTVSQLERAARASEQEDFI